MNNPSRFVRSIVLIVPIALTLTSCIGDPDGLRYPVPVGVGGSSGNAPAQPNAAPAPAAPMVAPLTVQDGDIKGVRESHGATSRAGCRAMAKRFKEEGRKVQLVDIQPTSDPTLRYKCVFEGEDAEPGYYDGYTPKNQN
jgi:hypothetical protein